MKPGRWDWEGIFATLAARHGWTYDQIGDMGLEQVRAAMQGPKDRGPRSGLPAGVIPIGTPEDMVRVWENYERTGSIR